MHLWQALRNRSVGRYKSRRQHPVGAYIVDFVCPEQKLVIEVDGRQHITQADQDNRRARYLETQGVRVLRFWDNDVLMRAESVLQVIFESLAIPAPSPSPRLRGEGI